VIFERCAGTRDAYGKALAELGRTDPRIVVLSADLAGSTKTSLFAQEYPGCFYNMGVAEADMIGAAAGMALSGLRPFASTFSVFATGKAWEQVRQVVAYPKVPVRIVATHAGLTVGEDGASHQMLEDIAIMRVLPNMTVIVPADAAETDAVIRFVASYDSGPVYVRLSREPFPIIHDDHVGFALGKARVEREGTDVSIVACGVMVATAIEARSRLAADGISVEVINASSVKPLDAETILASAEKTGALVTAEEHQIAGGLGSAVCELLSEQRPTRVARVGVDDRFGQSGRAQDLLSHYGLDADGLTTAVRQVLA
jgi:transketolase